MTATIGSGGTGSINITGLASGLNSTEIINALLEAEKKPVTRLTDSKQTFEGQRKALQAIQSSLKELVFAAQELGSPTLYNPNPSFSSSNSSEISGSATTGAPIGSYQVEVTQLASSSQRTFTFKSPAAAEKVTIDGQEFELKAGESLSTFVSEVNASSKADVYAASTNSETLVLSSRTTGKPSGEWIKVAGAALTENASLAKEGKNAEYKVNGVAGSSKTNTATEAIAGVTLNLKALTSSGAVTVNVESPTVNKTEIVERVQAFVKLYNSTVGSIEKELTTKPPEKPASASASERESGTLFGDSELEGLLNNMRLSIYESQTGLEKGTASLAQIGISTGAASGSGSPSQTALEGQLTVNTSELEKAIEANPTAVKEVLQKWSSGFEKTLNAESQAGGDLETRATADEEQITSITRRITSMNEMIKLRQGTLEKEFQMMEAAVSRNTAQSEYLNKQLASLEKSSSSSSSSSGL